MATDVPLTVSLAVVQSLVVAKLNSLLPDLQRDQKSQYIFKI